MRKLLFIFVVLTTLFSAQAQNRKIVIDETSGNLRIIEAIGTRIGGITATKILNIGLQTWVTPQDTTFVIGTNVNTLVPLGAFNKAIMLVKTMDDEVLEFHCVKSDNNTVNVKYGDPTVTATRIGNSISYSYHSNSTKVARNINYWLVTPAIIDKLKKGIKKIKIQYDKGVYEKQFKKDEIGEIIYDSYLSVIKRISFDKNEDFKSNF